MHACSFALSGTVSLGPFPSLVRWCPAVSKPPWETLDNSVHECAGLLGVTVPEDYGGVGFDAVAVRGGRYPRARMSAFALACTCPRTRVREREREREREWVSE